jgi:hypothetical protein
MYRRTHKQYPSTHRTSDSLKQTIKNLTSAVLENAASNAEGKVRRRTRRVKVRRERWAVFSLLGLGLAVPGAGAGAGDWARYRRGARCWERKAGPPSGSGGGSGGGSGVVVDEDDGI